MNLYLLGGMVVASIALIIYALWPKGDDEDGTIKRRMPEQRNDEFPPTLIQLDPPQHGAYRQLLSKRFTPRALKKIDRDIDEIGKEIVDALIAEGNTGECDFVKEVAAPLPIAVIAWLLGVPRSDWNLLFDWTNRTIGAMHIRR